MRRWLAALTACLAWCAVDARGQVAPVDRLVAVVGDQALMASDVRAALVLGSIPADGSADDVQAERLVLRELMRLEVDRFAVPPPAPAAVDARLRERLAGARADGSSADVDQSLLRRMAADDLRIAVYVEQRFSAAAQPTDVEVSVRAAVDAGRTPSPDDLEAARQQLGAERRQALVEEWAAGLRRRAPVRLVGRP